MNSGDCSLSVRPRVANTFLRRREKGPRIEINTTGGGLAHITTGIGPLYGSEGIEAGRACLFGARFGLWELSWLEASVAFDHEATPGGGGTLTPGRDNTTF